MNLSKKRVLVTGAGHGLGRELAIGFASEGCEVIVTDRDEGLAKDTQRHLESLGHRATGYKLDVTDTNAIENLRLQLKNTGSIDVLVNNAGVVFGGTFGEISLANHKKTYDVNTFGLVAMTHIFWPDLISKPEAGLLNIISASALCGVPNATTYASSKWAGLGFGESLKAELELQGVRNIHITSVCPGYISTGMFAGSEPYRFSRLMTPQYVAQQTIRAFKRDKEIFVLPAISKIAILFRAIFPPFFYRWLFILTGVSTSMLNWKGHGNLSNPTAKAS